MNINRVRGWLNTALKENKHLWDNDITVEGLRLILLNIYRRDVDKRVIGRILNKYGLKQTRRTHTIHGYPKAYSTYFLDSDILKKEVIK